MFFKTLFEHNKDKIILTIENKDDRYPIYFELNGNGVFRDTSGTVVFSDIRDGVDMRYPVPTPDSDPSELLLDTMKVKTYHELFQFLDKLDEFDKTYTEYLKKRRVMKINEIKEFINKEFKFTYINESSKVGFIDTVDDHYDVLTNRLLKLIELSNYPVTKTVVVADTVSISHSLQLETSGTKILIMDMTPHDVVRYNGTVTPIEDGYRVDGWDRQFDRLDILSEFILLNMSITSEYDSTRYLTIKELLNNVDRVISDTNDRYYIKSWMGYNELLNFYISNVLSLAENN